MNFRLNILEIVIGCIVLATMSYALIFIEGPRGTDQHWYWNDTQTIANNEGNKNNTVMPGMILRQQTGDPITYFYHNGPMLYLAGWLAKLTGAFPAWIILNALFSFGSALIVRKIVSDYSNPRYGFYAFCLYLISCLLYTSDAADE